MSCDESKKEDLQIRLSNTLPFKEQWKQNLIYSNTDYCSKCRKHYKGTSCKHITDIALKTKLPNAGINYKQDVMLIKDSCRDM